MTPLPRELNYHPHARLRRPTDFDWFQYLRAFEPPVDEVNFWKPGSEAKSFRVLDPGEPFFFKLKSPHNAIGGFGYFAHFSQLPASIAWEVYGRANGAPSYQAMRQRLAHYRSRFDMDVGAKTDFSIGCILINEPTFFPDEDWVRVPNDWSGNIVQGKGYDLTAGEGERIWMECLMRAHSHEPRAKEAARSALQVGEVPLVEIAGGYGAPTTIRPRLGQRSFRVAVLDSYGRRCAVTSERTLPALEAAHIREFAELPEHSLNNGILFRADIHKLFDAGYVTVTPDRHFEVSRRIKEEFENGRDYYRLHGTQIRLPHNAAHHPSLDALLWHNKQRYLG